MVPSDKFVQMIETEYLRIIADLLKSGDIDFKTAKESAKELLTNLPFISYEDMHKKLKNFTKKYPKLEKIFILFLKDLERENTQNILGKMEYFMKSGKIDESLKLVQK
jgi:ERCC4-related helicase